MRESTLIFFVGGRAYPPPPPHKNVQIFSPSYPKGQGHEGGGFANRAYTVYCMLDSSIEEGRAASKSPHSKYGFFISMSQLTSSVDIIPNLAVRIFSPNTEGTKT